MNQIRSKIAKWQQKERQKYKQELIQKHRIIDRQPSIISMIPYVLDYNHWDFFELLLDSISPKDIQLVSQVLKEYIKIAYQSIVEKQNISNEEKVKKWNIVRLMNRLHIIEEKQIQEIIQQHYLALKKFEDLPSLEPSKAIFMIMKEQAILTQQFNNNDLQTEGKQKFLSQIEKFLNSSSFYEKCCTKAQELNQSQYITLIQENRIYYAELFKGINFKLSNQTIIEIFHVVWDCFCFKQIDQIMVGVELISVIVKKIQHQDQKRQFYTQILEIMIINGLDDVIQFSIKNKETNLTKENFKLDNKNYFFTSLLIALEKCDTESFNWIIELICQLFTLSDNLIQCCFQTKKQSAQNQQVLQKSFHSFHQYLVKKFQSHFTPTRRKCYWLASNVIGSYTFYQTYGFQLLKYIFHNCLFQRQEQNSLAKGQLFICFLNFLCCMGSFRDIKILEQEKSSSQSKQYENAENMLKYILVVLLNIIQDLSSDPHKQSNPFLQRSVYAIFNYVNLVTNEKIEENSRMIYLNILIKNGLKNYMEQLYESYQIKNSQQEDEILQTISITLKNLSINQL